jgi:hypothetical protein
MTWSFASDRTFYKLVDWPKIRKNAQVIAWLHKRMLKKEWGESVQVFANIGLTSIYLNVHTPNWHARSFTRLERTLFHTAGIHALSVRLSHGWHARSCTRRTYNDIINL